MKNKNSAATRVPLGQYQIGFAYPSSELATRGGFAQAGCWYVETHNNVDCYASAAILSRSFEPANLEPSRFCVTNPINAGLSLTKRFNELAAVASPCLFCSKPTTATICERCQAAHCSHCGDKLNAGDCDRCLVRSASVARAMGLELDERAFLTSIETQLQNGPNGQEDSEAAETPVEIPDCNFPVEFIPQRWENNNLYPADPLGETTWLVPVESLRNINQDTYEADDLRFSTPSPRWVQDWSGPFEIRWDESLENHATS